MQVLGSSCKALFFGNSREITQVAKFHMFLLQIVFCIRGSVMVTTRQPSLHTPKITRTGMRVRFCRFVPSDINHPTTGNNTFRRHNPAPTTRRTHYAAVRQVQQRHSPSAAAPALADSSANLRLLFPPILRQYARRSATPIPQEKAIITNCDFCVQLLSRPS